MLFKNDDVARAEAKAIRENAAWFRWTHDRVTVTGSDADRFIEYMMVNKMADLPIGKGRYTTMLNEDGLIIDDLVAMHMGENEWWLSTLYGPRMVRHFDAFREGFDVVYEDTTEGQHMYAVQGPNSASVMNDIVSDSVDTLKRFEIMRTKIGDIDVVVDRGGFTGELGFEVFCTREDAPEVEAAIAEAADRHGAIKPTIMEVFVRSVSMEKGLGLRQDYYLCTPYEVNLGWSVHDDKEFLGKEALAERHAAGEEHAFVGLEIERESYEDIELGEVVYKRGVPVGVVKNFIYGYTVDKNIGFAVVKKEKCPVGTEVTIGQNDSPGIVVEPKWC